MIKRKESKQKFKSFVIAYFVFFTLCLSVITLSKYVSTSNGSGNSSVAKWEVIADTSDNASDTLNMTIGNTTQSYILKISSLSDTKASYSIVLSDLPADLEVKLDNEANYHTPINGKVVFSNVGFVNINGSVITHTLTFNVPIDSETISSSEINIDVIFTQVNPNQN